MTTTQQTQPEYLDVYNGDDEFLMRTTLPVLQTLLRLHDSACARIESEVREPGGMSQIHFNGKPNALQVERVMVQLAVGPRANY